MAHAITQRYDELPESTRQRLAGDIAAHLGGQPSPVAFSIPGTAAGAGGKVWLGMLVGFGGTALIAAGGYGQATESGVQPWPASLVYAGLLALAVGCLLVLWPLHRRGLPKPLARGAYFFPWDIVDTRNGGFSVYPLRGLQQLVNTEVQQNGKYLHNRLEFKLEDGRTATFSLAGQNATQSSLSALQAANQRLNAAGQAGRMDEVAALDPFHTLRQGKAVPTPAPSGWEKLRRNPLVWAVLAGALISQPLWLLRNWGSDNAMIAAARGSGTEEAYLAYVNHGWRHVAAARAALPRAAFEDARKAGTVNALRGALKRYPNTGLDADVAKEIHAIFERAFERFKQLSTRSDATVEPFVKALLGKLEQSGDSSVTVKFIRPNTDALARVDSKQKLMAPAARHFGNESAGRRESRMVGELSKGFRLVFPQDVLSLTQPRESPPDRPLMQVAYEIAPSGAVYTSSLNPGRQFIGVVVNFDVQFVVPGGAAWRSALKVLPPDRFSVSGASQGDDVVYAEMADRAFDKLSAQLNEAFFTPTAARR